MRAREQDDVIEESEDVVPRLVDGQHDGAARGGQGLERLDHCAGVEGVESCGRRADDDNDDTTMTIIVMVTVIVIVTMVCDDD